MRKAVGVNVCSSATKPSLGAPSRFSRSARQIPALSAWNPGSSLFLEKNLTLSTNLPFGIPRNEILDGAYRSAEKFRQGI